MRIQHLLFVLGALSFIIFVIAKNGFLVNEKISFIFSSEYIFYLSLFLVFMGYYLSNAKKEKGK